MLRKPSVAETEPETTSNEIFEITKALRANLQSIDAYARLPKLTSIGERESEGAGDAAQGADACSDTNCWI